MPLHLLAVALVVFSGALVPPAATHVELKALELAPWLTRIRRCRELHALPELSLKEHNTSRYIREELKKLGIPCKHPVGGDTGIVATIGRGRPVVALRADMDALPIMEESGVEFSSTVTGAMHACGHDGHVSMLLGAARLLKAHERELQGSVRLLFQPAEEGKGGAKHMIDAGALDGVSAALALHVDPWHPTGTLTSKGGPFFAASDRFEARIVGRGGHAAAPHQASDPVVAASLAVVGLQPLISRETDPAAATVVTVSRFNTGPGASNVIPEKVTLSGTIRGYDKQAFERLRQRVTEVFEGTARAHGCTAHVAWSETPYPPLLNDAGVAARALELGGAAARQLGIPGAAALTVERPHAFAEDFSFIAERVPAALIMLGVRNESAGSVHGLHSPHFRLDESALPIGAALHASWAMDYLTQHRQQQAAGSGALREEL